MKRVSLNCVISHEKSSRLISLHAHVFHNLVRNQPQYTSKISARKNAGDAYNNQAEEELPGPSRSNPNESLNDETGMTYESKFELLNFACKGFSFRNLFRNDITLYTFTPVSLFSK